MTRALLKKARALELLKDNGTMTTAQIDARISDATNFGIYSIMVGLNHKGYVHKERDTTPTKDGSMPTMWTISQSGMEHLACLMALLKSESPKPAPRRVRASFHDGAYRPKPWVSARSDADDHRQYASRGALC